MTRRCGGGSVPDWGGSRYKGPGVAEKQATLRLDPGEQESWMEKESERVLSESHTADNCQRVLGRRGTGSDFAL